MWYNLFYKYNISRIYRTSLVLGFFKNMKKIAFVCQKNSSRIDNLYDVLAKDYEVLQLHDENEVMSFLKESYDDLSVVIVDNPSTKDYIKDVFTYIKNRNNYMFSLPVLVLTDLENMPNDDKYLHNPVVDIIFFNDTEEIILRRIKNAVTLANSTSFDAFSEMLTVLPSLVYLKDRQGRYAFCSQTWHHLNIANESIRGKTDFDVRKDKRNAQIARESDLEVINSGKGKSYIIKESDEEGTEYLQVIKEPLKKNGDVYGIIAIINNVTESELLRQKLREKSITDQLTGLYNRVYFDELTHWEGKDLRFPITIISADCDGLKQINDKFGHSAGDQYICYARDAIRKALPDKAVVFRMGGDEFLAVVPETDKEEAQKLVDRINKSVKKYKNKDFALSLSVGSHTIKGHNSSIETGVRLSDKEMYKVKKEHKTKIK